MDTTILSRTVVRDCHPLPERRNRATRLTSPTSEAECLPRCALIAGKQDAVGRIAVHDRFVKHMSSQRGGSRSAMSAQPQVPGTSEWKKELSAAVSR